MGGASTGLLFCIEGDHEKFRRTHCEDDDYTPKNKNNNSINENLPCHNEIKIQIVILILRFKTFYIYYFPPTNKLNKLPGHLDLRSPHFWS